MTYECVCVVCPICVCMCCAPRVRVPLLLVCESVPCAVRTVCVQMCAVRTRVQRAVGHLGCVWVWCADKEDKQRYINTMVSHRANMAISLPHSNSGSSLYHTFANHNV